VLHLTNLIHDSKMIKVALDEATAADVN
jgi:hypothetical protein